MKKKIIILVAMVLCIATVFCACSKKDNEPYTHEISVKLDGCTVKLSTSKEYVLEALNEDTYKGFAVFYNDGIYDNFAIGSFLPAESFETFRLNAMSDDDVQEVYENTNELLYYSVINKDDNSLIEYNRIVKVNKNYIMYIGSFDKEAVDTFYTTLIINVK